jgi:hypothetical protein
MRMRFRSAIVVVAAAMTGIVTPSAPASASMLSRPFTWQGISWCPTFYAYEGCNEFERSGTGSSAAFSPSQVTYSGNSAPIYLRMNSNATRTGAIDTQTTQLYDAPATLSETVTLPCTESGQVDNWPAFWIVTTGSWPAGGEIDVMEGLSGAVYWHYHYLSASGVDSSVGGPVNGFDGCGTHTYEVNWTTSAINFYYDGTNVGTVTPGEIGVPIASGPMFVVNDYAASSEYGGPTVGNVNMEVADFTATT